MEMKTRKKRAKFQKQYTTNAECILSGIVTKKAAAAKQPLAIKRGQKAGKEIRKGRKKEVKIDDAGGYCSEVGNCVDMQTRNNKKKSIRTSKKGKKKKSDISSSSSEP